MVDEVADIAYARFHRGADLLVVEPGDEFEPHGLLLAVTLGSSLAFMLPTSCRSNLLVSGAGGYRSRDFMRVGFPLTIVVGVALLGVLYLINF